MLFFVSAIQAEDDGTGYWEHTPIPSIVRSRDPGKRIVPFLPLRCVSWDNTLVG